MQRRLRMLVLSSLMLGLMLGLTMLASPNVHAQGSKKKSSGKGTIEIRKDKRDKFRFFYLDQEGKTLAMCVRGYETEADAKKGLSDTKSRLSKKDGVMFKKDKRGMTRFSIKNTDGKTLAMCVKGYATEADAQKTVDEVKTIASSATPKLKE